MIASEINFKIYQTITSLLFQKRFEVNKN